MSSLAWNVDMTALLDPPKSRIWTPPAKRIVHPWTSREVCEICNRRQSRCDCDECEVCGKRWKFEAGRRKVRCPGCCGGGGSGSTGSGVTGSGTGSLTGGYPSVEGNPCNICGSGEGAGTPSGYTVTFPSAGATTHSNCWGNEELGVTGAVEDPVFVPHFSGCDYRFVNDDNGSSFTYTYTIDVSSAGGGGFNYILELVIKNSLGNGSTYRWDGNGPDCSGATLEFTDHGCITFCVDCWTIDPDGVTLVAS